MSAYLDAELPAHEAEEFESMIAGDPAARSELEDLRKVMALVASLPDVEAPPDFAEKVTRRVRRRQLFAPEALLGLVSLPFQVLSMIVILAAAALYMMAQLDRQPTKIERDRASVQVPGEGEAEVLTPGQAPLEPIRR